MLVTGMVRCASGSDGDGRLRTLAGTAAVSRLTVTSVSASGSIEPGIVVNYSEYYFYTSLNTFQCQWNFFAVCATRGRPPRGCDTVEQNPGDAHGREAAANTAGPDADQSRRKRATGAVQQLDDDSPQFGRVHPEFHLHFPQRRPGQAVEQHDRQSWPRETHLARAWREYLPLRGTVRNHQGVTGEQSDALGGLCSIGSVGRPVESSAGRRPRP